MILYFTGSGNSLAIARYIADKTNDKCISMYDSVNKDLSQESRIGIIFPTYGLDAPRAVKQLIPQIKFPKNAYTYIVITCGAQTNNAIWTARKLLKNQNIGINYCNKIRLPDSSAAAFGRNPNDQKWKFDKYAPKLEKIVNDITSQKRQFNYAGFDPIGWISNKDFLIGKLAKFTTPATNPEKCVGCGLCAQLCQQKNITIDENKAKVGDNCTCCLACMNYCPHQAMEVNKRETLKENQYHHPSVGAKEFISATKI